MRNSNLPSQPALALFAAATCIVAALALHEDRSEDQVRNALVPPAARTDHTPIDKAVQLLSGVKDLENDQIIYLSLIHI